MIKGVENLTKYIVLVDALRSLSIRVWTLWDSNPELPGYEPDALTVVLRVQRQKKKLEIRQKMTLLTSPHNRGCTRRETYRF